VASADFNFALLFLTLLQIACGGSSNSVEQIMTGISIAISPIVALFLALHPAAFASSTWYVNGVNGNDHNDCKSPQTPCKTVGHAVSLASAGDTVRVGAAIYKENLSITFGITISGSKAATTIVDGGATNSVVTVSGSGVTLSNLTFRNGKAEWGGGIYNTGTLTVNSCSVSGNSSVGKGFRAAEGGGILNFGKLTINNSTVSGNTASGGAGGAGGGIFSGGILVIANSTITQNETAGGGGGILTGGYNGNLSLSNVTISGNSSGFGGGIDFGYGSAIVQNSIVASNSGGDCEGSISSKGHNLSSDSTCGFNGPGDMNNTNPMLGPLANNGGPTQTMALLSGSPAIDAGNPSGCADGQGHLLKTDQRGEPRPDKEDTNGCDIGAYERQTD
jgi:hypothetical protein